MTRLEMHRKLLLRTATGLVLVLAAFVVIHGWTEGLLEILRWLAVAIVGMFAAQRVMAVHLQAERADERVDGSAIEDAMLKVVMWTPAVMLALLMAAALHSGRVFESLGWIVIVLGACIGRDAEAVLRLNP